MEQALKLESQKENSKTPDSIDSMLNKLFSVMRFGSLNQSYRYIPLNEIARILNNKFSYVKDINDIIKKYVDKQNELFERFTE